MAVWTCLTLVGNGWRVVVDQVRADDFRSAMRAWARVVAVEGMTDEARRRMAASEPPADAEDEFIWDWDTGVWTFGTDLEMDRFPAEWGGHVNVWIIKTDARRPSSGDLPRA